MFRHVFDDHPFGPRHGFPRSFFDDDDQDIRQLMALHTRNQGHRQDTIHTKDLGSQLVMEHNGSVVPLQASVVSRCKLLILYFGGSWCPHCVNFLPKIVGMFQAMREEFGDRVLVVYISNDRSERAFEQYIARMPFPALPYNSSPVRALDAHFGVTGIPTVFFLLAAKGGKFVTMDPDTYDASLVRRTSPNDLVQHFRSQIASAAGGEGTGSDGSAEEFEKENVKGLEHFRANRFDKAIEHFSKALAIAPNPKHHAIYSNRAAALMKAGRHGAALADANKMLEIEPHGAKGYKRKGEALLGLQKFESAIAAFEAGLALEPHLSGLESGLSTAKQRFTEMPTDAQRQEAEVEKARAALSSLIRAHDDAVSIEVLEAAIERARNAGGIDVTDAKAKLKRVGKLMAEAEKQTARRQLRQMSSSSLRKMLGTNTLSVKSTAIAQETVDAADRERLERLERTSAIEALHHAHLAEQTEALERKAAKLGLLEPMREAGIDGSVETLQCALHWCDDQGATRASDIARYGSMDDFLGALRLKPIACEKLREALASRSGHGSSRSTGGSDVDLHTAIPLAVQQLDRDRRKQLDGRFTGELKGLVTGRAESAAHGLRELLKVPREYAFPAPAEGVAAIEHEVRHHGTKEDQECLEYVLRKRAGAADDGGQASEHAARDHAGRRLFSNSRYARDCDASGLREDRKNPFGQGMELSDFLYHAYSREAGLEEAHGAHARFERAAQTLASLWLTLGASNPARSPSVPAVLALRLYTTAAFKSLVTPLRDLQRTDPHPFPATIHFIAEGIGKLRVVDAKKGRLNEGSEAVDLWRGLKDMDRSIPDAFRKLGGTEYAPMSTTTSLEKAIEYSASRVPMLMRLHTPNFMQRGASISYLSAFPAENEVLYPPLTFMQVKSVEQVNCAVGEADGVAYTVVEVTTVIGGIS